MTNIERFREKREYFGLVAEIYDRSRPRYHDNAITHLVDRAAKGGSRSTGESCRIADVGCGTGIFTRQIAKLVGPLGDVIGIEPTTPLRVVAEAASDDPGNVRYMDGVAEELPLGDATCDLVTTATSANWFNRMLFYGEAKRVLKPDGVLGLLMNKRRYIGNEFLSSYETFLESILPIYTRGTHGNANGGFTPVNYAEELETRQDVHFVEFMSWTWESALSGDQFVELALTNTVVQRAIERHGEESVLNELRNVIRAHLGIDGLLTIPFVTELTVASFQ
ncbi:class I SAM-dependent methyltransferase [Bradyrhizobium sp. Ec3.3]|uniref:class I SAM-dependent methyltransferase n=1 Tax=Bradyrhizobium sp. Ec3.3 TaxID=189753 RepID=UPI00047FCD69|nr:class I SAM-dependent methyltransferase [Bradyrhizobium sp. Ec3.3]